LKEGDKVVTLIYNTQPASGSSSSSRPQNPFR